MPILRAAGTVRVIPRRVRAKPHVGVSGVAVDLSSAHPEWSKCGGGIAFGPTMSRPCGRSSPVRDARAQLREACWRVVQGRPVDWWVARSTRRRARVSNGASAALPTGRSVLNVWLISSRPACAPANDSARFACWVRRFHSRGMPCGRLMRSAAPRARPGRG